MYRTATETGLTSREAETLLQKHGSNNQISDSVTSWQIFARQWKSPFVYLLLAAAGITIILNQFIDASFIILFLAIDIVLGFIQEYRSNQAAKILKSYIIPKTKVIRDGKEITIETTDVVPGDLVILQAGDKIPADVRFIDVKACKVDESILTGESVSIAKYEGDTGLAGTNLIMGKAKAIVIATGKDTQFGTIAKLTIQTKRTSTFEKEIGKFSQVILRLVVITLFLLTLTNVLLKQDSFSITHFAIFAVALAVSVIPEALPVVTMFSLSRGALRMAGKKVVVKRLSSVEDLGSIEVLCTDKTGTITKNKMTVSNIWGKNPEESVMFSSLASVIPLTDSFDKALFSYLNNQQKKSLEDYQKVSEIPFDPKRRRNTTLLKKGNKLLLVSRGAPEEIIKRCINLNDHEKEELHSWIINAGLKGQRVLAVATKMITSKEKYSENQMAFSGVISFVDPLKPSTKQAIIDAKNLHVQIKILTGDSKEVAGAIAKNIGLIDKTSHVITGEEFDNLSAPEQLEVVKSTHVFARVNPEQKYKIIQLLEHNFEVGFLGEGINDAPALKAANVGIVVAHAADIAQDAADIILLQQNLNAIIAGIKEGRTIFSNTTKYITATLSANLGNFYAVAIASLLVNFLPMLPIQILLVNLLSDFPMISISTDSVELSEISHPKRYDLKNILLKATMLGVVSTVFDFIFFAVFLPKGEQNLQTAWFMGSIFTELVFLFSIRTNKVFWRAKMPSPTIIILSITAAILTIAIPLSAWGQNAFGFVRLNNNSLLLIFAIVAAYFVATEATKKLYLSTTRKSL